MNFKDIALTAAALPLFLACARPAETIPVITWAGVPPQCSAEAFPVLKECGIDIHLGLYGTADEAATALEAAQEAGLKLIPGFPQLKDSTAQSVARLRSHPALYAWHVKDEPETWDIPWIAELVREIAELDPAHPSYVNLYPNWAWGDSLYAERIERFASEAGVPFYSFDQYPITENEDGSVSVRPGWYRNLEEFSEMSRRHGRPFWAFALTKSHHLGPPSPEAFYPVPTIGHLRLQVFSDLLYGAQAIQYFTAGGIYDPANHCRTSVYDIVRQVNSEIRAYSPIFLGCRVLEVRHTGDNIPEGTKKFDVNSEIYGYVESLEISGEGGVVSLIENGGKRYVAVQNRDCVNPAILGIRFRGKVKIVTPEGSGRFDGKPMKMEPGDVAVFRIL